MQPSSVQGFPSWHSSFTWLQELPWQESVVQGSPSLHGLGTPAQPPCAQVSSMLQKLPSSQGFWLAWWAQVSAVQASSVQAFPSSQPDELATQTPA
jgi:hypothetical protein